MGGFAMTRFRRKMLVTAVDCRKIPFEFPTIVLSSTMLFAAVPVNPMPKLFPGAKNPFPIVRFARSRFSFEPDIHMPPQAAVR